MNNLFIGIAISLVIGFGAGYKTKDSFVKAHETNQLIKDHNESAANIVKAHDESIKIDGAIDVNDKNVDAAKKAIDAHFDQETSTTKGNPNGSPITCSGNSLIDPDVVRMLNDAKSGATVGASGSSNEASGTAK